MHLLDFIKLALFAICDRRAPLRTALRRQAQSHRLDLAPKRGFFFVSRKLMLSGIRPSRLFFAAPPGDSFHGNAYATVWLGKLSSGVRQELVT